MQDYDANDLSKFSHLTNNCVAKKFITNSEKKKSQKAKERERDPSGEDHNEESDDEELENIWSLEDFKSHLQTQFGEKYKDETEDIYQTIIYP